MASLDLSARRIVVASYLYYRLSMSMMTDAEFDKECQLVAGRWDDLEPIRQWQLGSPDAIRASGCHVIITVLAENAAWEWAHGSGQLITGYGIRKWRAPHKVHRCRWATLAS